MIDFTRRKIEPCRAHCAVFVQVGEQSAFVDLKIAPLIETLWLLGIETLYSCEDTGGFVWINFKDTYYKKFLDTLTSTNIRTELDKKIINRIYNRDEVTELTYRGMIYRPYNWFYNIFTQNRTSIYFPINHKSWVHIRLLERRNKL